MKLKFQMNDEDITEGVRHSCQRCPVARCVAREFPGLLVAVGYNSVCIEDPSLEFQSQAATPIGVQEFILNFDLFADRPELARTEIKPIDFELDFDRDLTPEVESYMAGYAEHGDQRGAG